MRVQPPEPSPATAALCERLEAALPDHLDDAHRRSVTPQSPLTAAWGDPPRVLRCGVPRPAGLTPTSDLVEVEHVGWFLVESAAGYTFTTTGRAANVELTVPAEVDRSEATAPLVDLAPAITRVVSEVPR